MRPILFHFQWFGIEYKIGSYAFFLTLAILWSFLLGFWALYDFFKNERPRCSKVKNKSSAFFFSLALIFSGIIGARLFHIFLNPSWYQENLKRIYSLEPNGFSIYGGILLCTIIGLSISFKLKLTLWRLGDALIPVFAGAAVLSRLGCWFNGCCYGKATNLPWGVSFTPGSPAFLYEMYSGYVPGQDLFQSFNLPLLHPTQLYEIIAILFGLVVFYFFRKKAAPPGAAALIFFITYTSFRMFNNSLRVVPTTFQASPQFYPIFYGVLLTLQIAALAFIIFHSPIDDL